MSTDHPGTLFYKLRRENTISQQILSNTKRQQVQKLVSTTALIPTIESAIATKEIVFVKPYPVEANTAAGVVATMTAAVVDEGRAGGEVAVIETDGVRVVFALVLEVVNSGSGASGGGTKPSQVDLKTDITCWLVQSVLNFM
jgi:hypothetical protein